MEKCIKIHWYLINFFIIYKKSYGIEKYSMNFFRMNFDRFYETLIFYQTISFKFLRFKKKNCLSTDKLFFSPVTRSFSCESSLIFITFLNVVKDKSSKDI